MFSHDRIHSCWSFIFVEKTNHMKIWDQIAEYLYLKKRDPQEKRTQWMKYMHGINRLSIILFLIAIVIMIVKRFL